MNMRNGALFATILLLAGCASDEPDITVLHRVPYGSTLAVVTLADCTIADQPDCAGSGAAASAAIVTVLSQKPGLHPVKLPRPVGVTVSFSDAAAIAYAGKKGYRYVINGEVEDFYRTGHLAMHPNHAAVAVRVLNTENGQAITTYEFKDDSKMHFTSSDDMLNEMAKQLATSIVIEKKKQRQGDFMFYKPNSG